MLLLEYSILRTRLVRSQSPRLPGRGMANFPGPWTAGSPNALAFNPLPLITKASGLILVNATFQNPTTYLRAGLDPTLVAGFTLQKRSLVERLGQTNVAAYEIINNNAGSLTVAVMHPFSRGAVYINSADPFEPPQIDPRWLSNPVDRQILVEAIRFNRQILATPSMRLLQAAQFVPPIDADEDAINQGRCFQSKSFLSETSTHV